MHGAGEDEPTVSLAGASADIHLNWTNNLTFTDGEEFSWRKVQDGLYLVSSTYVIAAVTLSSFHMTQQTEAQEACLHVCDE